MNTVTKPDLPIGAEGVMPRRYLRNPKVVNVREISDDCYLITDLEDQNEYVVSRAVLKREYEEI